MRTPQSTSRKSSHIRQQRCASVLLQILPLALLLVLAAPATAQAYIGPGAGFAIAGSLLVMFTALLSGIAALFTWPLRYAIRGLRGRKAYAKSRVKRFVILGLDGLDCRLTRKYMAEGKLPNLARLAKQGCFKELASTIPPISPVAWSSFQTGSNPGKHRIYDFLSVNPRTYMPRLSSVDIKASSRRIGFGKYQLPLGKADIRLLRKGKPFWHVLGEHGVFSNVLRVPISFPPEKFRGLMLSAMCVPDLRGTQGSFSFYTTGTGEYEHTGGQRFQVTRNSQTVKAELVGPENPFRKDGSLLKCPFTVTLNGDTARLRMNGQSHPLRTGTCSDWIKVWFKAAPGVKVRGICRLLLKSCEPEFELYVTPVNIDPEKPVMPIAHPPVYSTYFAKRQGPFATLGLAEDTWALNEKILDDASFLQQCLEIDTEREKMFFDALDKLKRGLCVCVFDATDRIQHTFWRYLDDKHPAAGNNTLSEGQNPIEQIYRRADELVGRTAELCSDDNSMLMVISDHGFEAFRTGVDLNRWLEENGYLVLNAEKREEKHLCGVDWSKTKAFAMGLAGIYLNLKGRYSQGIVEPGTEAKELRAEIAEKLTGLTEPGGDQPAIHNVHIAPRTYRGPYTDEAPDLIVGYNRGYRASWDTAIGKVTEQIFHPNTKAWSGDHCIDQSLVPGVLFCNRPIASDKPGLIDIGPTVLDMFGIRTPGYMDGQPLCVEQARTEPAKREKNEA